MGPRTRSAAALLLLAPACGHVAADGRGAEVLIVTIDTLRADFVSAYGAPLESTPHLDGLAREGVLLADHRAVISLTAPSHLSMFTGLLPTEHGLRTNGPRFPDDLTYLPELLARAGYRGGAFLGASILRSKAGFARGFEVFDEVVSGTERHGNFYERPAAEVVDGALGFLAAADDRPTFLWVHLYDPHEPYLAEARWLRPEAEARAAFAGAIEPSELVDDAQQLQWRRGYEAEVRSTDHELGRLLEAWDRGERGRRGLVIVTSDHGQGLGEHDYGGHGFHVYEEQLLVPFVARMRDRLPAGRRVDAPTTALDLARTVAELVGVDAADLGGRSLVPLLSGRESAGRPALLAERRELEGQDFEPREVTRLIEAKAGRPGASRAQQLVLVREPWKFLWTADGGRELYHLGRDPAELDNRAAIETDVAAELEAELDAWRASVRPGAVDEELSEETVRALRALGY